MKKIRILIVEDEALIAKCLKMTLESQGYEVIGFVASGEKAIITTKEKNPDIILMDIHLSGEIDGIDAAKEIIENKNIPIIFMTGYDMTNFIERAQKINPAACLNKPIKAIEVMSVINSIFK